MRDRSGACHRGPDDLAVCTAGLYTVVLQSFKIMISFSIYQKKRGLFYPNTVNNRKAFAE
jgi:hypothetical protein